MSPQVDNFVHSLVEMAKAQEMLPQVQQELAGANSQNGKLIDRINSIAADLEQSRTYAASLEQRCRDLEVARDDAELRFLDLEETSHTVRRVLNDIADSAQNQARQITATIDPPKPQPEPVKEPEPVAIIEDQRVPDPTSPTAADGGMKSEQTSATSSANEVAASDQSESSPTANTGLPEPGVPSTPVQPTDAGSTTTVTSSVEPSKPYTGKLYSNYPSWVSREDWYLGGGDHETYDWRIGDPLPESAATIHS